MLIFLLGFDEWYCGRKTNDDEADNWAWAFGLLFFEVVKENENY